jgi:ribosomal protein S18 acetylase RimI-like enzyme
MQRAAGQRPTLNPFQRSDACCGPRSFTGPSQTMNVREVAVGDVATLREVLARAFHDDPVFACIFPDEAQRRVKMPMMFETWIERIHLPHGECFATEDLSGAALWSPPGTWRIGVLEQLWLTPRMLRVFGRRALVAMKILDGMQAKHPKESHRYLAVIGTDPSRQGQGIGTQLLSPMLARCDRERIPAYLESSNEKNLPFYRRHGFEEVDVYDTPVGPRIWLMWRAPRPVE